MSTTNENMNLRRPDGTQRVVITGMGAVTPAGVGVDALWDAVMGKQCCIAPIERFDTSEYEVHNAGEVRGFDGTEHGLSKKEARRFERFVQYAMVAADEAMAQAGLSMDDVDSTRVAIAFGTGIGGIDELQKGFETLHDKGPKRVSPLFVPTMIGNIAAGNLAIRYGIHGACINVVTACATGAHNIGEAVRAIRHGYADAALVGGSEESVSPICIAGFTNLGALSRAEDPTQASLPFDVRRKGFVAGEGAGALVIESLEHALKRGATPIAEITGYGSTGDAYHMTAPDPEGAGIVRSMRQALEEGGFTPADIGHVNAHGTGTPANDKTESIALYGHSGDVHQGHDGPHARRGRCGRSHRLCAFGRSRLRAADDGVCRGRSGVRCQCRDRGPDGRSAEGRALQLAWLWRPQRDARIQSLRMRQLLRDTPSL